MHEYILSELPLSKYEYTASIAYLTKWQEDWSYLAVSNLSVGTYFNPIARPLYDSHASLGNQERDYFF